MAMMISKFHKIIQSKVVWTVFAILISVAFVGVYTGARNSGSQQRSKLGSQVVGRLYGEDITRAEFGSVYQSSYVMFVLSNLMQGRSAEVDSDAAEEIRQRAWERLATLKQAEKMGISATDQQVIETIKQQPMFMNRQTGQYDPEQYNSIVSGVLPRYGMNAKEFEIMIRQNVIIQKALMSSAQGALVTDDEVKKAFHLYNDKITVKYATLPRSLAETPDVSEEEAKAYFETNEEEFRFPEKVMVKYSAFDVAAYTNNVTVTDEMIAQVYESNKQRFLKPAAEDAAPDAAPEYKPLEDVKDEIVTEVTTMLARQEAYKAADAMVAELSDETVTFEAAAEKAGVSIVDNTPAFAASEFVKGIDPYARFNQTAFALEDTPTHYYSDPIVGKDTVYVMALVKKLPSWPPGYDLVKDQAMESAKLAASEAAYVEKANAVHAEINAALKEGSTFDDAVAKYSLELTTTAPFSISEPVEGPFSQELMNATVQFDAGTLANLIRTPGDFLIAYVAEKTAADEAADLPTMREQITAGIRNEKAARLARSWQESLLEEAGFEDLTKEPVSDES